MRIASKRIQVLYLSQTEVNDFTRMLQETKEGHVSHYAERQTGANAYVGVLVDDDAARPRERPMPLER